MPSRPARLRPTLASSEPIRDGAALILYGGTGTEWATQVAGLIFSAVMLGAIFMVHLANGWNSIGNMGMEFQVLILATSLSGAFGPSGYATILSAERGRR